MMIGAVKAGRRVNLLNPDWSKGYIDKFLVVRMDNTIAPIENYNQDALSAQQIGHVGDTLVRIRHVLNSSEILEDHFLMDSESTLVSRTKAARSTLSDNAKKCINAMRDPVFKMISNYLPGECMQPIEYDCNVPRKSRFIKALDRVDAEMYQFIVEQLSKSLNKDTPSDWRSARCKPLPSVLNIRERLVINSTYTNVTVSHSSQHWLLFMQDGTTQWDADAEPSSGGVIDRSTGKTVKMHTAAPRPIPKGVRRAIKFTIGIHPEGSQLVGVGWSLYEDKNLTNQK